MLNKDKVILAVVGTRPNFVKMKTVIHFLSKKNKVVLVHTGQHYDNNMSTSFFDDLELPKPDYFFGINSGTRTEQLSKIMIKFEKICLSVKPDLVVVAGDVNSTLACALAAVNNDIKLAHIESGLRSNDKSMPEEINRILTDKISNYLFVTEESGINNLRNEGFNNNDIFFVGNSMIDSLTRYMNKAKKLKSFEKYGLKKNSYCLVTMHRPSNVDNETNFLGFLKLLNKLSNEINILFPLHPRTKKTILKLNYKLPLSVKIIDPVSYLEFIDLMASSSLVLTDSGGIQEESTFLGVQCVTFRNNTERPSTISNGTNHLVGTNTSKAFNVIMKIISGKKKKGKIPEKWDGNSGKRVAKIIEDIL